MSAPVQQAANSLALRRQGYPRPRYTEPMPANEGPIQRLAHLGLRITSALAFLAPLLTRIVIGVCMIVDGNGKLHHLDKVTGFFTDLGIPFPGANAAFISGLELI